MRGGSLAGSTSASRTQPLRHSRCSAGAACVPTSQLVGTGGSRRNRATLTARAAQDHTNGTEAQATEAAQVSPHPLDLLIVAVSGMWRPLGQLHQHLFQHMGTKGTTAAKRAGAGLGSSGRARDRAA